MRFLKQSTSVDVKIGPFLDETDGKTAETALTITQPDIRLAKNGGAWAQKNAAQTLSHEEAGWYEVTLDATDTDTVGCLMVAVHESGALPVWHEFHVLEEAVYDALIAASAPGYLQPTTAGRTLDVTATGAAGVDWANVENQSSAVNLSGSSIGTAAAVTAIDTGGIVAASFASGAITAGAIAADAIGASELAADAVAEIADAVWDEARSGHTTDGTFGQVNQAVRSGTAQGGGTNTITLDASASATDDLYNGCLAWIVAGTGAGQAGVITDYVGSTKVATVDNNWRTNPDNTTVFVLLPGSLGLTSATLASAVWGAARASYNTAGTFGEGVLLASAAIQSIWDALTSALTTVGSIGKRLVDYLTGDIYARLGAPAGASVSADIASIKTDTGTTIPGRLPAALVGGRMDANVGAISSDATAADNAEAFFDGTGYAGTNNVIPTVTSVTAIATGGITAGSIAADAIGASELAADAVAEIQSGLATAANLATLTAYVDTEVAAIKAKTDNLPASPAATGDAMTLTSGERSSVADAVWEEAIADHSGTSGSTAEQLAAAGAGGDPWATAVPGSYTTGQAGKVLADILDDTGTSGVVSVTGNVGGNVVGSVASVTGAVGSVTGNVGGNVVGSVASVTGAVGSVTGNVGGNVTGNLGGTLTSTERNAIADALLNRGLDGAGASSRKVREALAFMRNKWSISGTTLTVYDVDDTTSLFTATITSASGNPVTGVDPA